MEISPDPLLQQLKNPYRPDTKKTWIEKNSEATLATQPMFEVRQGGGRKRRLANNFISKYKFKIISAADKTQSPNRSAARMLDCSTTTVKVAADDRVLVESIERLLRAGK